MKYRIIKWNLPSGILFSLEEKDGFFGSWQDVKKFQRNKENRLVNISVTFATEEDAEEYIKKIKPLKEVVREISDFC